jgi:hypothetical protein
MSILKISFRPLVIALLLALFLVVLPAQTLASDCGVLASGTLYGPTNQNFGAYTVQEGSTVSVSVTNTGIATVNYTVTITIAGFPFPLINSGSVNVGETETASSLMTQAVVVSANVLTDGGSADYELRVNCPEGSDDSPPPSTDGRLGGTGTDAAIYVDNDEISVYVIDAEGNGTLALSVDPDSLDALPDFPETNTLIAQSADGFVSLYKLTTGEYQFNIGPDAEGKTRVIIFDGIPPSNVYGYQL